MLALVFALALPGLAFADTATAGKASLVSGTPGNLTIQPSGDKSGKTDGPAIKKALASGGTVTLAPGEFYTDRNLIVVSNTTINANGATVYGVGDKHGGLRNEVIGGCYSYNSVRNVTVNGGTWAHVNGGSDHSMMQFTHGSNITFNGVKVIESYDQHAIEFIACDGINIIGCTVESVGAVGGTMHEDAIQFDIASPKTAPSVQKNYGAAAVAGQTCQNILVQNCNVVGSRGIATNYTKDKAYSGKCHKNITITGCNITGQSAEGVALFNVTGKVNVSNNTIVSNCKKTKTSYSIGLHFATFGKFSKADKKASKKTKVVVQGNAIYGGRQGIFTCSHASGTKLGKFTVTGNKVYCKKGKKNAIKSLNAAKFKSKKNKTYKWK